MAEMVKVSLLQPRRYRETKDGPVIKYPMGLQEMPVEHARTMGLMHRIRREARTADGQSVAVNVPFAGAFDDKLSTVLVGAGFKTIEDLSKATQDDLMSIEGIGPAAYERIRRVVKGEPN